MISLKCMCCVIILIYAYMFYQRSYKSSDFLLAVGVLSSRSNFKFREAIRSTWLKGYLNDLNNDVKAWFIVGKEGCYIPPLYRLSPYGCEKWIMNSSDFQEVFYTTQEVKSDSFSIKTKKLFSQGFSFKVNHPVIVQSLGILNELLAHKSDNNVAIMDVHTREILIQSTITPNSSTIKNGFLYEDVDAVLLPKNFEGLVLVEGHLKSSLSSNTFFNNGSGVITINRIYSTPHHLDSFQASNEHYSAVSIKFLVDDIESLKSIALQEKSITQEWIKQEEHLDNKLMKESAEKKDMVFVDVMDTYRNLPDKLLHFYHWLDKNYDYLYALKTDDDTVIDIPALKRYGIKEWQFVDEHWVWSKFRRDWPVNYIGKWADFDYRSPIYPAFPCGAAYVISRKTLKWLSSNIRNLFSYQGEDVSMGIWLSAIKPIFNNDNNFECDSKCKDTSYNRAQLTPEEIYAVWDIHKKCDNLCFC